MSDGPIAVLGGTGDQGLGLALRLCAAGRDVVIGSRTLDRATAAAAQVREQVGVSLPRQAGCRPGGLVDRCGGDGVDAALTRVGDGAHDLVVGAPAGVGRDEAGGIGRQFCGRHRPVDDRRAYGGDTRIAARGLGDFRTNTGRIAGGHRDDGQPGHGRGAGAPIL